MKFKSVIVFSKFCNTALLASLQSIYMCYVRFLVAVGDTWIFHLKRVLTDSRKRKFFSFLFSSCAFRGDVI